MQDGPVVDHLVEQTIQHSGASGAPATVWWAQPSATLISAAAVIVVAVCTFRHNRNKLEREQREKRAKDHVQHLQGLYGDSLTAAHQVVRCVARMTSLQATADGIEDGTIHMEREEFAGAEIDRLISERTKVRETVRDRLSEMATANARLLLAEGPYNREYRLSHLTELHDFLTYYSPSHAKEQAIKAKVANALSRIVTVIGASLHAQYYLEAGVPMPGLSMSETQARIEEANRLCRQTVVILPETSPCLED